MTSSSDATERLDELEQQAREFADSLTSTVLSVVPEAEPFEATLAAHRAVVRQRPGQGIPLTRKHEPLLTLKWSSSCEWDLEKKFLAIRDSKIEVFATAGGAQPLFRYEYLRSPHNVPAAHLQIHAHRDALTYVMTKAERTSKRPGRTGKRESIPTLQDLHFPLGGHRFRPALEDFLEMLIDEFDIDHDPNARKALADGRMEWRLTQTKAAVRDAPGAAVAALESLGYTVTPPAPAPSTRHEGRLREF